MHRLVYLYWQENDLKWQSESETAEMQMLFDKRSISSEANSDAVFSNEAHEIFTRQQQSQVLWQAQEIEETLCTVPNGRQILDMVKSACFLGAQPLPMAWQLI